MRQMQKHGFNKADVDYWNAKGWVKKARPWKNNKKLIGSARLN